MADTSAGSLFMKVKLNMTLVFTGMFKKVNEEKIMEV
jgi:hypothetical protein